MTQTLTQTRVQKAWEFLWGTWECSPDGSGGKLAPPAWGSCCFLCGSIRFQQRALQLKMPGKRRWGRCKLRHELGSKTTGPQVVASRERWVHTQSLSRKCFWTSWATPVLRGPPQPLASRAWQAQMHWPKQCPGLRACPQEEVLRLGHRTALGERSPSPAHPPF